MVGPARRVVMATLAPATDGLPFLVGLSEPYAELMRTACGGFAELGPVVRDRGGAVGLLRSARRLQTLARRPCAAGGPAGPAGPRRRCCSGARLDGEPAA